MDITPYIAGLRAELANAADLGGQDARALAERLAAPLESAFRLALLEALSTAAGEISRELAPGSVELRLRGREPSFAVTLPSDDGTGQPSAPAVPMQADGDEAAISRINLRVPDTLKSLVEQAAGRDGLSVNAWLVRALAAAVQPGEPSPRSACGGQRFTGWVR